MRTNFLPCDAVNRTADLGQPGAEAILQLKEQQAKFECELEIEGKWMSALRDRHGETLDSIYTYIEWLGDALHETYCHENLDHIWESIETIQDEMGDKAPALLEELEEQNRMVSDLRESQKVFLSQFKEQNEKMFSQLDSQAKQISSLTDQNTMLVSKLEEQTKLTNALKQQGKMKQVLHKSCMQMIDGLEYQKELTGDVKTFESNMHLFEVSHNGVVNMVENMETWTSGDFETLMLQDEDDSLRFTLQEAENLPLAGNRPRTVRALASTIDKQAKKIHQQKIKLHCQKQELCEQETRFQIQEWALQRHSDETDQQTKKIEKQALEIDYLKAKLEDLLLVILAFGKDDSIDPISQDPQHHQNLIEKASRKITPFEYQLYNTRQEVFCAYLYRNGVISGEAAHSMVDGYQTTTDHYMHMAEVDARMFQRRMDDAFIPNFVNIYGVTPSVIINSTVIKHPSIFQVVNWVGSVHLQGLNLSHGVQVRFDFILQMLKEGKYKKAIQDCEGLLDDLQKGLL